MTNVENLVERSGVSRLRHEAEIAARKNQNQNQLAI
jgi:hypothetical protein